MPIYIAWLALFPFVLLYGAYEGPKVFWLWIGGFCLTLWWIRKVVRSRMPDLSSSARWFLVWLLVLAVASMVGVHPIDSLVGGSYRHQGVLFFFTLFLVWQAIRYIKRKQQDVLSILFASGVGLESIIILIQTILNPHAP